jgi:hypothetical protein
MVASDRVDAAPPLSSEKRDNLAVSLLGGDASAVASAVASAGKGHRPISSISATAFVSARRMLGAEGQDGPRDRFDWRADADSR